MFYGFDRTCRTFLPPSDFTVPAVPSRRCSQPLAASRLLFTNVSLFFPLLGQLQPALGVAELGVSPDKCLRRSDRIRRISENGLLMTFATSNRRILKDGFSRERFLPWHRRRSIENADEVRFTFGCEASNFFERFWALCFFTARRAF